MGGKGGGGGDYYQQPADTSGYGTLDEATKTLAAQAPLDLSGYQQSIDVQKAAALATAPTPIDTTPTDDTSGSTNTGTTMSNAVLAPPTFWQGRQDLQPASLKSSSMKTTQT